MYFRSLDFVLLLPLCVDANNRLITFGKRKKSFEADASDPHKLLHLFGSTRGNIMATSVSFVDMNVWQPNVGTLALMLLSRTVENIKITT